ncbi:hypothetical protein KNE206_53590 [Kitasatospora sp. NE20-6]|uniref:hypothetical protein n=1 Tax=Kitasatospora sp. NE20-6 TaxID=2859066 RepID=UPI0034DC4268
MTNSPSHDGDSLLRRRLLIGLVVLVVAGLLAGLCARLAGGGSPGHPAPAAGTSAQTISSPVVSTQPTVPAATSEAGPGVARPPHTSSPTAFATAFATALWTYDARAVDQQRFVNGLRLWLTSESVYADGASVQGQVPDPVLWSRLRDTGQTSTATSVLAHVPDAFTRAVAKDPGALATAYIYALTVTAKVNLAWDGGGRGAEDRAITLAVQCRPQRDCALAAIAPTVYP